MRRTTLTKDWEKLTQAVGGITALCEALEMSQSTFYRISRGHLEISSEKRRALEVLCDLYDVDNPLASGPIPWNCDLAPLRMMGEALAQGFPTAGRTLERLRGMYPKEQLIELAENDDVSEEVLRAVSELLE